MTIKDGTYLRYGNLNLPIKPDNGYWVASIATTWEDLEDDSGVIFGVWTDTDTGQVYYDRVAFIEDLEYAIELGRTNEQIAIWDIANNKEIRL
jgi:hypothetical protein